MLRQSLLQKQIQKLSPQQIQLVKLLQIPTIGLEQRIKEELEENPALEEIESSEDDFNEDSDNEFSNQENEDIEGFEDNEQSREDFNLDEFLDDDEIPSYKLNVKNSGEDTEHHEIPISNSISFHELLSNQLGLVALDDKQYQIAEFIIGNIDGDGYMRRELSAIIDDLAFKLNINTTEEEVERLLHVIQQFDPPGVAARDLQECLTLQLKRKYSEGHNPVVKLALQIVEQSMEEFSKKHYEKIAKRLNLESVEEGDDILFKDAIGEILKLNPKPGNSMNEGQKSILHIIPDFILLNNEGQLELSLNSKNAPELRVSRGYKDMLEEYSKSKLSSKEKKEVIQFVKDKIDKAKWFIDAINQRNSTLMIIMQTILEYQQDYFQEGDITKLKPMILKNIADIVNLDISTVSRVTNGKYIQTSFGTIALKELFSESSVNDLGEEISTREIKKILQELIESEKKNKPYTDDKLAKILKEKGYNIARRTVAKYREQLDIPVARMRKEV
ncbi:MAG: RNA polymerase factor sigma-54 [Bacteroidia bacterium]|nr:RNA polymerase factor sigma-54 [Bacteroidia bacterium]MCZ2248769.1 RNA polymerase factor sigma-54 [Bacteroidia bacterium]